jgi:hypothetical protein
MTRRKKTTGPKLVLHDPERLISQVGGQLDIMPILQELLVKHSLHVAEIRDLNHGDCKHGWQLRTHEGPIINVFFSGTVQKTQGHRPHLANNFVEELRAVIDELRHGQRRLTRPPQAI